MMVDLNEKELETLMMLASKDWLEKRTNQADVVFEEVLALKLTEVYAKETGHVGPCVPA